MQDFLITSRRRFKPTSKIEIHMDAPDTAVALLEVAKGHSQEAYNGLARHFFAMNSFELVPDSDVDVHPVRGSSDPTSLVTMCRAYTVVFKPRNERILREALKVADERLAGHEKS